MDVQTNKNKIIKNYYEKMQTITINLEKKMK